MDNKNDERLVVLGEYGNDIEANIVKGVLETNGVPCVITNEILSSVLPIAPLTLKGALVRVMVFERDLDLAQQILRSEPSESFEETQPSE